MKYLKNLRNKLTLLGLVFFTIISILLHLIKIEYPCFNSDEASFAYNAHSIAKTGKDEYGSFLPSRFLAFGENKLPVTIYLMAPFVGFLGLSEITSRLPFILIGIFSPLIFYFFVKKLTESTKTALISSFLVSFSPFIQIMSRHIHENIIMLIVAIAIVYVLSTLYKGITITKLIALSFLTTLSLFTYHMGKVLSVFVFFWILYFLTFYQKNNRKFLKKSILIFGVPILFFLFTEFKNPSSRISNLLFLNNPGFTLNIESQREEHNNRLFHNKITHSIIFVTKQYISYFSPEFLVIKGDANRRFGVEGVSPITAVEYIFAIVGIYFAFHKKIQSRYLLISLLFIAPASASLSWQGSSITRSFLLIIPIIFFGAYGIKNFIDIFKNKILKYIIFLTVFGGIIFYSVMSWDYYFNHYLIQKETQFSWQCGYKGLGKYINENYDNFDKFYITKKLGQPYIFTLFYTKFNPTEYQKQANLSAPDEYGFGQVEKFDKFIFDFKKPEKTVSATYIGFEEDFPDELKPNLKRVSVNDTDIFFIYEVLKKN